MHNPARPEPDDRPDARRDVRAPVRRRAVLLGAAAAVGAAGLSGCSFGGDEPTTTPLDTFLASTAALADQYDAALAANPDLAGALTPLRDAHRAHLAALASAVGRPTPAAGSAQAVTGDRSTVFAALATAERAARDEAVTACLNGTPRLAGLLGSVAAARASHLEVLR